MIAFIAGVFVGGFVGALVMAAAAQAGQADDAHEQAEIVSRHARGEITRNEPPIYRLVRLHGGMIN